ncbi:uncharacterized protein LOC104905024 [Beta vulgaris subsp. vulgaris]|uniref:uncharacterized protein LOC104905024 n=1 Tax=Beta vulgaris subsp. vulgaris TaxID=3555 RepID=UPI002037283E|nr:uncharacterized protein LOC104905024 [Beta vulgaris subsp. vulgaris]
MSLAKVDDSIQIFRGHTKSLFAVACSPTDATLVATGGRDDRAFLWRIGQGDCSKELAGHKNTVSSLAFSSDGQLLASGGLDASVKIWDTSGNLKSTFGSPMEESEFEWVTWHPNGHLVLAGCTDKNAYLWNADKHSLLNVFCGHAEAVTCGNFTPDGKNICTGSEDATLRLWNPRSGESIRVIRGYPYHSSPLTCLTFTLDSTLALTGAQDGSLCATNITNGKVFTSESLHSGSIQCIGLSPSVPWVATGGEDQKLVIWDLQHSASRGICNHEEEISCLKWLGETSLVASGCRNGDILVWDTRSGMVATTFRGHSKGIQSLSVSADCNFLVSASKGGTGRVFDISKFK